MKQITNHIMMIEPVSFNFNEETSIDNHYQNIYIIELSVYLLNSRLDIRFF